VSNLDDFQKDVLHRTVLKYYDKGKFSTAKNVTFALREKIVYKGSVSSTTKLSSILASSTKELMMGLNSSWSKATLLWLS
jgi:hypothetical protein